MAIILVVGQAVYLRDKYRDYGRADTVASVGRKYAKLLGTHEKVNLETGEVVGANNVTYRVYDSEAQYRDMTRTEIAVRNVLTELANRLRGKTREQVVDALSATDVKSLFVAEYAVRIAKKGE